MTEHQIIEQDGNLLYFGLLAFGLILSFGLCNLYWSFGTVDPVSLECLNCDLSAVGANGVDNLWFRRAADYSIGTVVFGALGMIIFNAFAWHRTNGY